MKAFALFTLLWAIAFPGYAQTLSEPETVPNPAFRVPGPGLLIHPIETIGQPITPSPMALRGALVYRLDPCNYRLRFDSPSGAEFIGFNGSTCIIDCCFRVVASRYTNCDPNQPHPDNPNPTAWRQMEWLQLLAGL